MVTKKLNGSEVGTGSARGKLLIISVGLLAINQHILSIKSSFPFYLLTRFMLLCGIALSSLAGLANFD
jgi:hypothetical protein